MTEQDFRAIYLELIEENPFAVRAALRVLALDFTEDVKTLAVSCEERPVLKVNLSFLAEQCRNEVEVKSVILHEFLHVLLRHTDTARPVTPARHLATDAVINAMIHRQLGEPYSDFMSRYYAREEGVRKLLRRPWENEVWKIQGRYLPRTGAVVNRAWSGLYSGELVADDIEEIAEDLAEADPSLTDRLLGGHDASVWATAVDGLEAPGAEALERALDRTLRSMNGDGIWRSEHGRGIGARVRSAEVAEAEARVDRWCRKTFEILKRNVDPDVTGALSEDRPFDYVLPVLSTGDRRAVLRSTWSPFLPEATWQSQRSGPLGGAQVYLDVSGSMNGEMPHLVKLLGQLSRYIKRPFWAFSNEVAPARIEGGILRAGTTGGTSMACVLEHVARTAPPAAVVLTDGYIEPLTASLLGEASKTRLHAIVTRNGSTHLLEQGGIPTTQLEELPQ